MNQEHIKKIDDAFLYSRERYENLKNELEASDAFNFAQARYDYFNNPMPRIQLLLSQIVRWRKDRSLKYEIDSNAAELDSYRKTRNLYLNRQYVLITSFTNALSIYVNDNARYDYLIESLHSEEGKHLTKADFILAIELYYISIFELVENSMYQYDPDYKKRLDRKDYSIVQENPFINLDYGLDNAEVISSLFTLLNGKEIKSPFEDFATLFKPNGFAQEKIIWYGTEPQLVLLLKGNFRTETGLKTKNRNVLLTASERFLNRKQESFNASQMGVVEQKIFQSTSTRGSEKIIKFLIKINS